jgi:hypothetical protein
VIVFITVPSEISSELAMRIELRFASSQLPTEVALLFLPIFWTRTFSLPCKIRDRS